MDIIRLLLSTVVPVVFVGFGMYLVVHGLVDATRAQRSSAWPSVMGAVLTSEVEKSGGGEGGPTYRAGVTYEYDVQGSTHVSKRVHFADDRTSWGWSKAKRLVAKYRPEQRVDVYYDPDNPKISVLEPGFNSAIIAKEIFGLIFLGISIFAFTKLPPWKTWPALIRYIEEFLRGV